MNTDKDKIAAIKKLIKMELDQCQSDLWPNVCQLKSSEQGYHRIEDMILNYAAEEGMPIGSAIALIEQEFAHAKQ